MPETQRKEQTAQVIPLTVNDMILMQVKDLKEEFRDSRKELSDRMDRLEWRQVDSHKELSDRMDRLERRQDKLEEKLETTRQEIREVRKELTARMDKQDDKIDRLADKIDALAGKIDSAMNHGQIITVSAISIAVGVLYAVFFK